MPLSFTPVLLEIFKEDGQRFKQALTEREPDMARVHLSSIIRNIGFYLTGMQNDSIASKRPLTIRDKQEIAHLEKIKKRFENLLAAMQQPNVQPSSDGAKFYFQFVRMMLNLNE